MALAQDYAICAMFLQDPQILAHRHQNRRLGAYLLELLAELLLKTLTLVDQVVRIMPQDRANLLVNLLLLLQRDVYRYCFFCAEISDSRLAMTAGAAELLLHRYRNMPGLLLGRLLLCSGQTLGCGPDGASL